MSGALRVRTTAAGQLAGDEPFLIDRSEAAVVLVEACGAGRFVVHGPDGRDTWAFSGEPRLDHTGIATVEIVVDGWRFQLEVDDEARARLRERATREAAVAASGGPHEIRAIIPGRIAAVRVSEGERVGAGRTLLVVEAMKMQNELRAPRDGTVMRVAVGEGETIDLGDLLVVLG